MKPPRRTAILLAAVILTSLAGPGCRAWQFGAPTLQRFDIRSVHVPMIESDSFRKFLGVRLTEAVVKDIELNTSYVVTGAARADSFLVARIRYDDKTVLGETVNDDPRLIQVGMRVEVTWVDRNGAPLMQRQTVRISDDYDFIPESGQSMVTTQQEIIDRIARPNCQPDGNHLVVRNPGYEIANPGLDLGFETRLAGRTGYRLWVHEGREYGSCTSRPTAWRSILG